MEELPQSAMEPSAPLPALDLVVMTPFPAAGRVKTGLLPALSGNQAADVHRAFLLHFAQRLSQLRSGLDRSRLAICYDPPESGDELAALLRDCAPDLMLAQSGAGLGHRLANAAIALRAGGDRAVLFFGTGSPDVPDGHIAAAAALARRNDVVVGPTPDGSHWCLAISNQVDAAQLFHDIRWSTGQEFKQITESAQRLGLRLADAPEWDEMDEPADLLRLISRLEAESGSANRKLLEALAPARLTLTSPGNKGPQNG